MEGERNGLQGELAYHIFMIFMQPMRKLGEEKNYLRIIFAS